MHLQFSTTYGSKTEKSGLIWTENFVMMMICIYQLLKRTTFRDFPFSTVRNFGTTFHPPCRLCAMPTNLKKNLKNFFSKSWQNAQFAINYFVMHVIDRFSQSSFILWPFVGGALWSPDWGRASPGPSLPPW